MNTATIEVIAIWAGLCAALTFAWIVIAQAYPRDTWQEEVARLDPVQETETRNHTATTTLGRGH